MPALERDSSLVCAARRHRHNGWDCRGACGHRRIASGLSLSGWGAYARARAEDASTRAHGRSQASVYHLIMYGTNTNASHRRSGVVRLSREHLQPHGCRGWSWGGGGADPQQAKELEA